MAATYIFLVVSLLLNSSLAIYQETFQVTFSLPGSPYIKLGHTIAEPLTELTLCYWVRPHNNTANASMTVLSYALPKRDDEILSGIVIGVGAFFNRQNRNKSIYPTLSRSGIYVGVWKHVCVTWSSLTGTTRIFIDGRQTNGFSGIALGSVVEPGGSIILGQDQDVYGGNFKPNSGLQGDISELHMWNVELCDEIEKIYKCELAVEGNVISWSKARKIFFGGIEMSSTRLPCGLCN